jgi:acetyl/propionyl-CoA carboxylase alpha subunit/acetyl-CoA carboxylase carboxyltransferase component
MTAVPMATIHRLGILDRGEPAVRVLNAVGDLNHTGRAPTITTVLVHRDADPRPWYGREADEVVGLGSAAGACTDHDLVASLHRARIDTLWLGDWVPGARADLIAACEAAGIAVVGPDAATVRTLSDPRSFAALCIRVLGGVDGPPPGAATRRAEIDIVADGNGTVWMLGIRDVSVRRGDTLLLCELPAAGIDGSMAVRMGRAAVALAREAGYRGAGRVDLVHDERRFAITGFDAAAAPVHAGAEERTGVSIIAWRLRVHQGEALPASEPAASAVAFEARLLAEDADAGSAITPGRIALLSFPVGAGVRIDGSRRVGDHVGVDYPLLGVVTATGPDRALALGRLRRALERTGVVIDGGACNRTLLLELLRRDDYARGAVDDRWFARALAEHKAPPVVPVVLLAAATEAYEADHAGAKAAFFAAAARGRPEQPAAVGAGILLAYGGISYRLDVDRVGPNEYSIRHGQARADITVDAFGAYERRITCGGHRHRLLVAAAANGWRIETDGGAHLVEREDGVVVRAGWPALVVAVHVQPGMHVGAGDPIAVLESMKMETTVGAPMAGVVVSVSVGANHQVEAGAPLLRLRPGSDPATTPSTPGTGSAVDLTGLEERTDFSVKLCKRVYGPLGNYLLGYDLPAAGLRKLLTEQRRMAEIADAADLALLACEDDLLDIYADLGALYRPKTEDEPDEFAQRTENTQEHFLAFLQWLDPARAALPPGFRAALEHALGRFGVQGLQRTPALESAVMGLFRSFTRVEELTPVVTAILQRRIDHRDALLGLADGAMRTRLERLAAATQGRQQAVADLARDLHFHCFDEPPMVAAANALLAEMAAHLQYLAQHPKSSERASRVARLVWCPQPVSPLLMSTWRSASPSAELQRLLLEVHIRRYYRHCQLGDIDFAQAGGVVHASARCAHGGDDDYLVVAYLALDSLPAWSAALAPRLAEMDARHGIVLDLATWSDSGPADIGETARLVGQTLSACAFGRPLQRVDVAVTSADGRTARSVSFSSAAGSDAGGWVENTLYRDLHPMLAKRLEIWRLSNFELERRPAPEHVHLFLGVARSNPADRRLFALAEIRDLDAVIDAASGDVSYPRLERTGLLAMAAMRTELLRYTARDRPVANRLVLDVGAPWTLPPSQVEALARRFAPLATRAGLEKLVIKVRIPDSAAAGGLRDAVLKFEDVGRSTLVSEGRAGVEPVRPLGPYQQKVLTAARFGSPYPYEIVRLIALGGAGCGLPTGGFQELDLGDDDQLVPVQREPGTNTAHVIVGLVSNPTDVVPEGMRRVMLLSDPTQGLGNLAEPECRRINAALAYAAEHQLPVEWFAVCSGALIAMDSGTENMDWIALTLRRLIEFTQGGGEVNIVVTGINVGGQPYWNAEATMLMHTRGILVMTPASAMVLTGKQALDFSGAVSADDNFGIGGYDRVMGLNGQAQYFAPSFPEACALLMRHYALSYVVPGERFPRRRPTSDRSDRDVCTSPHAALAESPFRTVGDLFASELNAERKQPFDMRSVMRAVADSDSPPLERWKDLAEGDTSIVWDTTIGGIPVCLLGLESHKLPRKGYVPADGPPAWTAGTLFPHSSRKTARAINATSGNRPLVVLANLSGFDGSPESMRRRQLEYGAEIGRAVTNFKGPIVFVVVSRYHGGAFVVFSKALNASMEIAAIEGSVASVIGGTPAAATVFAREVKQRTDADAGVRAARKALAEASGADVARLRAALADVLEQVRSRKLGEVAAEFDAIHTVERAQRVGSVDRIIGPRELRPYIVDALERGMARWSGDRQPGLEDEG